MALWSPIVPIVDKASVSNLQTLCPRHKDFQKRKTFRGTPKPETTNPKPETLNPKPETPNPKPETLNPRSETPNPCAAFGGKLGVSVMSFSGLVIGLAVGFVLLGPWL